MAQDQTSTFNPQGNKPPDDDHKRGLEQAQEVFQGLPPERRRIIVGIGAIAMTIFTWMRSRFLWWPLHPIGFPIMATRVTDQIWFSVMLAWLIKVMVLKYGGTPLFRRSRHFFLGMILGSVTVSGLWLVIDFFTGQVGNHVMRDI